MSEIYALSDDVLSPNDLIIAHAHEILKNGIKYYQYRCKTEKNEQIAREILKLCNKFNAKFIVNDDIEFALKVGAKCVHIGKDDADLKYARSVLGNDAFIGVSCYNDLDLAIKMQENTADYVAFGAVYPSQTKPNTTKVSFETIKQAKEILKIPVCVIGGINTQNIAQVASLGVDMIAIVNAIYKPESITKNILNLKFALNKS